ncbi:hypothetical protein J5690_03305 [bacterium]|nr:hypothetical protein [bacterium]
MKKCFILFAMLIAFLLFSCSSSHSTNDTDILPDSDADTQDWETVDDDSDSQSSEIVDDSEEQADIDSDENEDGILEEDDSEENCNAEDEKDDDEEEIDDTDRINGYKRCYDEIPDEPYEGLFADPKIEIWIRGALHYDWDYEIQEEDLEKVTEIGLPVKDLRGVEKLVNLESAEFFDTDGNIYDFTPLSKLKKLKKLRISSESMTCLDGSFSFLTSLEALKIENTQLKDVSPIEKLVNLVSLDLGYYNKLESLPKNIGNLQKLESFNFPGNNIKDIKPLKSLTNLKKLFFHYNDVEDLSPIKCLVNLTHLGCENNKIKDISPVTNLVNLTRLILIQNRIKEIPKEIVNLKKLQILQLDYNNIRNLPDLKGLDSLAELRLAYNKLNNDDFSKLNKLEIIGFLDISFNGITKVPVLKNVKSLYELYLVGNNITDLTGFADNESFPALRQLELQYNKIENAEPLRKREGLSRLSIYNNCIKDVSPLEELQEKGTHVSGINDQLDSCENTTITLGEGE